MENFLTIAPPTSKDGAALFAPLSRPECKHCLLLRRKSFAACLRFRRSTKAAQPHSQKVLPIELWRRFRRSFAECSCDGSQRQK